MREVRVGVAFGVLAMAAVCGAQGKYVGTGKQGVQLADVGSIPIFSTPFPSMEFPFTPSADWKSALATVQTKITPRDAEVYLDGRFIGRADDFDGWPSFLFLIDGEYGLEFRHLGYEPLTTAVDARPGDYVRVVKSMKAAEGRHEKGRTRAARPTLYRFYGWKDGRVVALEPRLVRGCVVLAPTDDFARP
jgi:hypothetical protein